DERGILHSVASRNDHDAAMAKLEEFGIAEYSRSCRIPPLLPHTAHATCAIAKFSNCIHA
ncbi:hypothetical protein, partial [Streptomyces prasinus]|uniref:hypothetical protein n=1 Tax=Streptomyces prasinus TaxID=67345 RepID=UPI0033A2F00D